MSNKNTIERKVFFESLVKKLSDSENKSFTFKSSINKQIEGNKNDDLFWILNTYKTYAIDLDGHILTSHTALATQIFMNDAFAIGKKCNLDTYITFDEINQIISPLIESYPYLDCFYNREIKENSQQLVKKINV